MSYFAVQAENNAERLAAALHANKTAHWRGSRIAVRLVQFIRDNPNVARLPSYELVRRFQLANPDVTDADLDGAFAPPPPPPDTAPPTTDAFSQPPLAGGRETGGFNPAMFGD